MEEIILFFTDSANFVTPLATYNDVTFTEQDSRYWMLCEQDLTLEDIILDSPHDIDLWIKIAYNKLNIPKK